MERARRRRYPQKHRALLDKARPLYHEMLEHQEGGCALCKRPPSYNRRLDIDHDHRAMTIRGLLCVRCNRALASWITVSWLRAAADYMENPPAWKIIPKGDPN